jgi:hypothetical protein
MVTTRTAASVVTKCHSAASGRYIKPNVNNDSNEQANSDQRHNKGQSMKGGDTAMLRRPGDGKEVMDIDAVEQKTKNNNKEQASWKRAVFTGSNINDASRMLSPAPVEAKDPAATTVAASTTETAVSTSIYELVGMIMSTNAEVVVKGLCGLLEAVAHKRSNLFDIALIAVAGANRAVLSAMLTHADSPTIQVKACSLIKHMAVRALNQHTICQTGGLDIILQAMDTHKEDFDVQKEAIDALDVLFSNEVKHNKVLAIVLAIAQALRNFKDEDKRAFQKKAFEVYGRMFPQVDNAPAGRNQDEEHHVMV